MSTTATISSSAASFTSSQARNTENSPLSNTIKKITAALATNPSLRLERISDYQYKIIGSSSLSRDKLQEMLCKGKEYAELLPLVMERTKEEDHKLELLSSENIYLRLSTEINAKMESRIFG